LNKTVDLKMKMVIDMIAYAKVSLDLIRVEVALRRNGACLHARHALPEHMLEYPAQVFAHHAKPENTRMERGKHNAYHVRMQTHSQGATA